MAKIYLVRHGEAETGWGEEPDPGLSQRGRIQAEGVAQTLAHLGPIDIVSSPFTRARETSLPLVKRWGVTVKVEERVGEIPTPTGHVRERLQWFRGVMADTWSHQGQDLQAWRKGVIEALCGFEKDTVVFSHFIVINVAVGAAIGDDRVVSFWPDNGSVTQAKVKGGVLTFVKWGDEAVTEVL